MTTKTALAAADYWLLRHIFTNLLANAVKYSPDDAPVDLRLERQGTAAVCWVADRGIGIPAADQEWLFQTFHRGRNVGQRPGTGLGLVIVKCCVERHWGDLQIHSLEGEGTTVVVRLPLFAAAASDVAPAPIPPPPRAADDPGAAHAVNVPTRNP